MTDDDSSALHDAVLQAEADEHDPTQRAAADEIARLVSENAALKEQSLRYAAEAENTRRRTEREANDARAYAIQRFARDLLDAADNLERALAAAPKDSPDAATRTLVTGVEMTEKAIQTAFERNGLKRLEPARGDRFDPNVHQAVMEQPAPDVGPGAVTMVMQPGYELFGRVVRPAMVAVTPKAAGAAAASTTAESAAYAGSNGAGSGATVDTKA